MARTPKAPAKPAAKPDATPTGEAIPAALAATRAPSAKPVAKPAPAAQRPAASAKPVAPIVKREAPAPAAKPAPVVPAPEPTPVVAAPEPAPIAAVQAPVPEPVQASAPVPTAAVPATPVVKEDTMATNFEQTAETATAKGQAVFADMNDRAKGVMEKGAHAVEEMNAFAKGNIEALVESSKIAAKGAEEIAKYSADYARTTVEKANATARQFAGVKSPTEFFQLQSEVAKTALDSLAAEGAKFAENYLKLLGEIAQPLSNRVALAADKVKAVA